jgi:hypothetical protein
MEPWSEKALTRREVQKIGLVVAVLIASTRVVAAQGQHEHPPYRPPCTSLDDCNGKAFDTSGTPGRMGLGADPAHPEGSGNPLV